MSSLQLEPDRALPFPAEQRSIAREIYAEVKDLPLMGPRKLMVEPVELEPMLEWPARTMLPRIVDRKSVV